MVEMRACSMGNRQVDSMVLMKASLRVDQLDAKTVEKKGLSLGNSLVARKVYMLAPKKAVLLGTKQVDHWANWMVDWKVDL